MIVSMVTDVTPGMELTTVASPEKGRTLRSIMVMVTLLIGLAFHILAVLATRKSARFGTTANNRSAPYFLVWFLLKIDFFAVVFFLIRGFAAPLKQLSLIFRCEFGLSSSLFFTTASGFANVVMCTERCFSLMAPFMYEKHVTLFRAKMVALVVLLASLLFTLLPFMGVSSYRYETEDGEILCVAPGDLDFEVDLILVHTTIFFVIGFSIMLLLVVCNLIVVRYILKFMRDRIKLAEPPARVDPSISTKTVSVIEVPTNLESGTVIPRNNDELNDTSQGGPQTIPEEDTAGQKGTDGKSRDIQLAALFIAISVIYTISWLPLYAERLIEAIGIEVPTTVYSVTIWLLSINHIVDPILFVFFKKRNQEALKLVLWQTCCRCSSRYRATVDNIVSRTAKLPY